MLGDSFINKLDVSGPKELRNLVTLRPLVAPLLHSGHYSLRPLGYYIA